ncbi:MAG: AraC family transcriptional regulator [Gemmatimonadetes bacterium]|nr:AraC family transcriptional regulator [Gemmatimonadota bacterium]
MDEVTHVTHVPGSVPFEILRGTYTRQRFAPHMHDTYAIGVIERGGARAHIGREEHFQGPGDVIVIEPHVVHTGAAAVEAGWSYRMFYLPPALVAACAADDEPQPHFERCQYADPAMAARMVAVHRLLEGDADLLQKESAMAELLNAMLVRYRDRALPRAPRAPSVALERVRDHLTAHFNRTVRLAELSRIAGLSPFHLIRQFRKAYGLPPYAYLELVRVNWAKAMLVEGARLSDVTFAAGFSDQSHFTRRFKRVFGYPPGRYLRSCATR